MLLSNFSLVEPVPTIILTSHGVEWDLHSFAEFEGFTYDAAAGTLAMRWHVPTDAENPWGNVANTAVACELAFRAIRSLQVISASEAPHPEDTDLADISWAESEKPTLVFSFESGRVIEVSAESAELRSIAAPVPKPRAAGGGGGAPA